MQMYRGVIQVEIVVTVNGVALHLLITGGSASHSLIVTSLLLLQTSHRSKRPRTRQPKSRGPTEAGKYAQMSV